MKWRSADCPKNGVLEVLGNLFLRLKCCEPRCEDYRECECGVEKMFNAAALYPDDDASGMDSVCCFNEKLFDYGDLKDFDGLCEFFFLEKQDNNGKTYYSTSASNWLSLLTRDRKLMFAIFAHITESVEYQHFRIFGELGDHWSRLIKQDVSFYIDFRRMKQLYPKLHLETSTWVELCEEHRELYGQLLADGECEFSDQELASLLARYPDLDDQTYEALKKVATGEVWMQLLLGGTDKAHKKFWDDCDYSSLSGTQWIWLLSNASTRDKAMAQLNSDKYSYCFTDINWKTLRGIDRRKASEKSCFLDIKLRPNGRNFTNFFRFAPQHAARAQFGGMIGISLAVAVFGMAAMLLWMGAGSISLWAETLVGAAIWAVLATACISCVAVGKKRTAVLHGILVGAAGGAGLLLFSLCFCGWYVSRVGIEDARSVIKYGFAIVETALLVLFFIAAVPAQMALRSEVGERKKNLSWVFYIIFAVMIAGGAGLWFAGTDKGRYDYCSRCLLQNASRHFEGRFLAHEKYWERWKRACENGDAAELRKLTEMWHPKLEAAGKSRQVRRPEEPAAEKQLMNALLKERENNKAGGVCPIDRFVKEQWGLDAEDKRYIRDEFIRELANGSTVSTERIIAFLKVIKEYDIPIDAEMNEKVMSFTVRRRDIKDMEAIWAELDDKGRVVLASQILTRIRKDNFSLVKDIRDVARLIGIDGQYVTEDFWEALLEDQVVRGEKGESDFLEKACQLVGEKMPGCVKLVENSRKNYRDRVTQGEIDRFEENIRNLNDDKLSAEDFLEFLQRCKHLDREENGFRKDWLFWLGYAKMRCGRSGAGDWKSCFDAFLNLQEFKFDATRNKARENRGKFAKMLVGRDEDGREIALRLWKKCLEDDEDITAYSGILNYEQEPAEFGKYFFKAVKSPKLAELREQLKENASKLGQDAIHPMRFGDILTIYGGKGRDIPDALRRKIETGIGTQSSSRQALPEIAKYYLAIEEWKKARETVARLGFSEVRTCIREYCDQFRGDYGEICYKLALIDTSIIDRVKSRLGYRKYELSELRESFEKSYKGKNREFVQEAVKHHCPEAIFVMCLGKYFESLRGDSDFDIGELEEELKAHHPDSQYVEYLERLKEAAGR